MRTSPAFKGAQLFPPAGSSNTSSTTPKFKRSVPVIFNAEAASGALEIVNFVKVANLCQTIKIFKKNNFWVFGLDGKNNVSKNLEDLPKKCLFVFGAEGKGLREKTSDECDDLISIPINLKNNFNIDSLNVSNACSIILYEHFKKYK